MDEEQNIDPWEPMNRRVFAFNEAWTSTCCVRLPRAIPLSCPIYAQRGVTNFITNIYEFNSVYNSLLQGRPEVPSTAVAASW